MSWRNLTVDDNFNIKLVRGDTAVFDVPLVSVDDEGHETPYTPQEGEKLRFALSKKEGATREEVLILKEIPISTLVLRLDPEDTKPIAFGKYKYDIEFTDIMGAVTTVLKAEFEVAKEVY